MTNKMYYKADKSSGVTREHKLSEFSLFTRKVRMSQRKNPNNYVPDKKPDWRRGHGAIKNFYYG